MISRPPMDAKGLLEANSATGHVRMAGFFVEAEKNRRPWGRNDEG